MKHLDQKMKNNESSTSDVINGNWVLKRKRKKTSFGPVKSNGNKQDSTPSDSHTSTSSKCKANKDNSSDHSPSKKKGNDGVSFVFSHLTLKFKELLVFVNHLLFCVYIFSPTLNV